MIPLDGASMTSAGASSWQRALQEAVRDPAELCRLLDLPPAAQALIADLPSFPLLVPRSFVARMRRGDASDPLLRQVLPLSAERDAVPGFSADPLRERAVSAGGVLRKYAGRALLIASGACPVHCRYCFRREFPYPEQLAARNDWSAALAALRRETGVGEVILSGGDPLSLSNRRLGRLVEALARIPSLQRLRVHTRFPIMVPERVDEGLLGLLSATRLQTVIVVHANHPQEIDVEVANALLALKARTSALLNQSVLLKGVNDSADALAALSERLIDAGVLPYYLHMLDKVAGAAHFAVDDAAATGLVSELRARLPGYLVPRLVREIPGELSKTLIL